MTKRLIEKLGQVLYAESCRTGPHGAAVLRIINAVAMVLDEEGQDFRLFLRAAGADDEEQARGRIEL